VSTTIETGKRRKLPVDAPCGFIGWMGLAFLLCGILSMWGLAFADLSLSTRCIIGTLFLICDRVEFIYRKMKGSK
jgi:hypothetical protein